MRKPCASIQIEITPPSLEYCHDYINGTLQVCRFSSHFLFVWAVLYHFISYSIASIFSGRRYAFSSTKQQHTHLFLLGSERKCHSHLSIRRCIGLISTNTSYFFLPNSEMWPNVKCENYDLTLKTCLLWDIVGLTYLHASHIQFSLKLSSKYFLPGHKQRGYRGGDTKFKTMSIQGWGGHLLLWSTS